MSSGLSDRDIKALIQESFKNARDTAKRKRSNDRSESLVHRERSQIWVEALAGQFRSDIFKNNPEVRVFSRRYPNNRHDFGLNELLYDIVVCKVGKVESPKQHKILYYIREAVWQIESEFANNLREALFDFNKLVVGSAANKLFVGPQSKSENASYLEVLLPAARSCQGNVFTALIPHPCDWDTNSNFVEIWKLDNGKWLPLDNE